MFQSPDYSTLSMKLSEVMEDIGVNEDIIITRRRVIKLIESIRNVSILSFDENVSVYVFGSQSEGSTIRGLNSDLDVLYVAHNINVMKDWSDWTQNKKNYLMIQDQNVTPGYCFLQLVRPDIPIPATHIPKDAYKHHTINSNGRMLLKNTIIDDNRVGVKRQGPASVVHGPEGCSDVDIVWAYPCKSSPQSALASNLLERQGMVNGPSSEKNRHGTRNGCFVVGANSKISTYPELEWRISTSLTERCLMHNLNLTQIQCYVLMKIILKEFLNPQKENGMSSFMCKTVLLHCIGNTEQTMWKRNNLLTCLMYCLTELRSCIQNDHCSHVIIPENNLMAGQFTVEVKHELLETINAIIQSDYIYLLRINIDDISHRLEVKLNTSTIILHKFSTPNKIKGDCLSKIYIHLAQFTIPCFRNYHITFKYTKKSDFMQLIRNLKNFSVSGSRHEQLAARYVLPIFCSILGSTLAASCIGRNEAVSPRALTWLYLGLDPDVTSGRLKLASVIYCTGNMYRTELVLRQIEWEYDMDAIVPLCTCFRYNVPLVPAEFKRKCCQEKEDDVIRHMTSFCVIFRPIELNCVPRELRYEMTRSTQDDKKTRSDDESPWMDCAAIDSLPFLYFLQYKTYDRLQRSQEKQHALSNLIMSIVTDNGFGHKETALNLLGKCMEQENRHREALHYYMLSLKERARNKAAKMHICCLLAKLVRNREHKTIFPVNFASF